MIAEPLPATAIEARPKARSITPERASMQEAPHQIEQASPAVVNAALRSEAAPRFVYLVTQTEQYDGFGNVTVTTSVWRVRMAKPAPTQVQAPVFPHQT